MRALRLTRRGRGVLLCGAALLLTGVITDIAATRAAGVFALAVCGSALAWAALRRRSVQIGRMTPPGTSAVGSELRTTAAITVGRPGFGPALVRNLTPPGSVGDHEDVRLDRPEVLVHRACAPQRRGLLEWPLAEVEVPDPLGIAFGTRQAAPTGSTLVFPQTVPLGRGLLRAAAGPFDLDRAPRGRRSPGDPGPVPRAYQAGDELRHMHWPATARAGDPMVRTEEPVAVRTAIIAIDCSAAGYREPEAFERAITACASISAWLLGQGWSVRVQTAQGRRLADSTWQLGSILAALAVLQRESSGTVVPAPPAGSAGAVISIHGARGRDSRAAVISLCTEVPGGDVSAGTLTWDGSVPLSSVWAAATSQEAVA